MASPTLVWLRNDLRLGDNPALVEAARRGAVIPLYIFDESVRPLAGGASLWWLHFSLASLAADLAGLGSRLVLRRGAAADILPAIATETGARAVLWNRRYEPDGRACDAVIEAAFAASGIETHSFNASLLHEPGSIRTRSGQAFRVFTPFWRACLGAQPPTQPLPAPSRLPAPGQFPASDDLDQWQLRPRHPDWATGLRKHWRPGEQSAQHRLGEFMAAGIGGYRAGRDLPAADATSLLSPHLHFGEISPRQIWAALNSLAPDAGVDKFRAELGWREFNHHLLFHFPALPERNFRAAFDGFPWRKDGAGLAAWRRGLTGYPIVDAGMRQLWYTGWMHNRVRMVAASFLIKHLLIDWRAGQDWFWDTLVDADLANNSAGWQWVAGSGADAAPYFRIFNPVLQGEKFDADGTYVRRWLPELAGLDAAYIHKPWQAPASALTEAGIKLGADYPLPIVEHSAARARALAAFASLASGAA